jgi:hypothetical protein
MRKCHLGRLHTQCFENDFLLAKCSNYTIFSQPLQKLQLRASTSTAAHTDTVMFCHCYAYMVQAVLDCVLVHNKEVARK